MPGSFEGRESKTGRSEEQPRHLGKWETQGGGGGCTVEDEVRGWQGGGEGEQINVIMTPLLGLWGAGSLIQRSDTA